MFQTLMLKLRLWRWKLLMGAGKLPSVHFSGGSDVRPPPRAQEQD